MRRSEPLIAEAYAYWFRQSPEAVKARAEGEEWVRKQLEKKEKENERIQESH